MHITRPAVYSIEDALVRLRRMLGFVPEWAELEKFLPENLLHGGSLRSAVASTFVAMLEMVRVGQAEMQQSEAFGPIFVRGRTPAVQAQESRQ